ncbi:hypothetical protein DXA60_07745 [Roseburia sp. OF03-24]|nr:hypothetical protein DXA60_07745 [Roseburia sp. OF03-24]
MNFLLTLERILSGGFFYVSGNFNEFSAYIKKSLHCCTLVFILLLNRSFCDGTQTMIYNKGGI